MKNIRRIIILILAFIVLFSFINNVIFPSLLKLSTFFHIDNYHEVETEYAQKQTQVKNYFENELSEQSPKSNVSKFDLREHIYIDLKDQQDTGACWLLSMSTVFETNMAIRENKNIRISARHMDYSTSNMNSKIKFARDVNSGGSAEIALSYLTNGSGPILEEDMPFANSFPYMTTSEITNKNAMKKVDDWIMFPSIYKEVNNKQLTYKNSDNDIYSTSEIEDIRADIKNHIMNYGAIYSITNVNFLSEYYNYDTNSYYNNNSNLSGDHAITIIGFDDNYSRDNFNQENRPTNDGAYIVLNSWGKNVNIKDGSFYVSYDDVLIEQELYGIISSSDIDYDYLYQYDPLGRNQYLEIDNSNYGYGANVFKRDKQEQEYLTQIGISTYCNMNYEIYINSKDGNINKNSLKLVKKSMQPITSGYHTIVLDDPILLTGNEFVVCIKYIKVDDTIGMTVEAQIDENDKHDSFYKNATSNPGESYVGTELSNMQDLYTSGYKNVNLCIKAFTNTTNNI